jgi:hypothetical protein
VDSGAVSDAAGALSVAGDEVVVGDFAVVAAGSGVGFFFERLAADVTAAIIATARRRITAVT